MNKEIRYLKINTEKYVRSTLHDKDVKEKENDDTFWSSDIDGNSDFPCILNHFGINFHLALVISSVTSEEQMTAIK